LIIKI